MAGGQEGIGQDPTLQLVGMAFGVLLYIPSSQFLCLCPSCAGEQRGAFCPMHRLLQAALGEVNEESVWTVFALRLLVIHSRG